MEIRIIYAIIAAFFAWVYNFILKISSEKNHSSTKFIMYSMFAWSFFWFVWFFIEWAQFNWLGMIFLLSLINALLYFISSTTKIEGLRYIDSSIFFPINKVISSILVIVIAFVLFSETLNLRESVGLVLWIIVSLFLVQKKHNSKKENYSRWIIFLIISLVTWTIASFCSKYIAYFDLNTSLYIWITFLLSSFFGLISQRYKSINQKWNSSLHLKRIAIINWFFYWGWLYFFTKAMLWNTVIVYTINSLYIVIPIFLSFLFYWEKLTWRKIIAIFLSIFVVILIQ